MVPGCPHALAVITAKKAVGISVEDDVVARKNRVDLIAILNQLEGLQEDALARRLRTHQDRQVSQTDVRLSDGAEIADNEPLLGSAGAVGLLGHGLAKMVAYFGKSNYSWRIATIF